MVPVEWVLRREAPDPLRAAALRFASKVQPNGHKDGCWQWTGAVNAWGYGNFRIGRRVLRAHRVAFLLAVADIPAGMNILHTCDNRRCCNPAHLRLGNQSENVRDEWDRYRKVARALRIPGNRKGSIYRAYSRTRRDGTVVYTCRACTWSSYFPGPPKLDRIRARVIERLALHLSCCPGPALRDLRVTPR